MYSRFTFAENAIINLPKVLRGKFLGSDGFFCFIRTYRFCSFNNHFVTLFTNLFKIYLRFRIFILLIQTKKVISVNYGSNTCSWKRWRWVRLDQILLMRDIYINSNLNSLAQLISSSRSTELKDVLSETLKYWVGVQWGQPYLMGRRCLFSLGWPPF